MVGLTKFTAAIVISIAFAAVAHAQDAGSTSDGGTVLTGSTTVTSETAETTTSGASATLEAGAYESLSTGNQKIAESLFNGQSVTADGSAPLSLDQIAAAKQHDGWGRIFKQMKADGLTDAKNLGERVNGRYKIRTGEDTVLPDGSTGATIVTTASGRQTIIEKKSAARNQGKNGAGLRHGNKITGAATRTSNKGRPVYKHAFRSSGGKSTYRGRLHSRSISGHGRSAASLGITSASRAGMSAAVTGGKSSGRSGSNRGRK